MPTLFFLRFFPSKTKPAGFFIHVPKSHGSHLYNSYSFSSTKLEGVEATHRCLTTNFYQSFGLSANHS